MVIASKLIPAPAPPYSSSIAAPRIPGFTGFYPETPVNDARVYPTFDIRCQFAGKEFADALGVELVFLAVPVGCCGL